MVQVNQDLGESSKLTRASASTPWVFTLYLLAYTLALVIFLLAWSKFPTLLYVGRDGSYALWVSEAYRNWARPFDLTSIDPMQGMTSMLVAINPYLNPGQWPFRFHLPYGAQTLLSFSVYFLEVTLSTFALGRAIGFSNLFSFAAACWLAVLLFPPFNYVFSLQGWLATAPLYGHTLALSNLTAVAVTRIGTKSFVAPAARHPILVNWVLATCIFLLLLASLVAAPFYNAGLLLGSVLLSGIIVLASSRREIGWRLLCGAYVGASFFALGMFTFYLSSKAYSARFALDAHSSATNPPITITPELIKHAEVVLCGLGVACSRIAKFSLTGSYLLHGVVIFGALVAAVRMPRPISRIAIWLAVVWSLLLLMWVLASLGVIAASPFSPVYFYLMLYPLLATFSLYAMTFPIEALIPKAIVARHKAWMEAFGVGLVAILLVALGRQLNLDANSLSSAWNANRPRESTPIVEILKAEISLAPQTRFRGSVATIYGMPGGSIRPLVGLSPDEPVPAGKFEDFLRVAAESGNSHDLLDLWWSDIPTLSEYGQGVSIPLMFYMTNFLSQAGDHGETNFAFPRRANVDVLRAMGVRFIVSDTAIQDEVLDSRYTLPLKSGATLHLYALSNPNLGTYSPTALERFTTPTDFIAQVNANPDVLAERAYVSAPTALRLTPARDAKLEFEKGRVHLTARSDGTSALLLPIQYSHCYHLIAPAAQKARVMRANIIHTLVIFEGTLDAQLRWKFNFFGHSGCRREDVNDLKALGLIKN